MMKEMTSNFTSMQNFFAYFVFCMLKYDSVYQLRFDLIGQAI